MDVRVKELPENWTIGQRAEVFIETGRKADALVAAAAIRLQWREGKPGVFVDEQRQGALARRDPRLARTRDGGGHAGSCPRANKSLPPAGPKQPPLKPGQRVAAK